jgi:hypothetical protein
MKKVLILCFLLASCGSDKTDVREEELEILNDEIFAVRLQMMPDYEKTMFRLTDSLNARKSVVKPSRADSLQKAIIKLDSVKNMMANWQKNYDSLALAKNDNKAALLREQKENLLLIKKKSQEGIQNANNLLMMKN